MSQEPPTTSTADIIISPQQPQIQNSMSTSSDTSVPVVVTPTRTVPATKTMQVVKSQDVRVDNWGNYCLQRLQVMYDRGDFCDLILQFHNNQILKVHRVVVNLCTEYFANLERLFGLQGGMLVLPKDIEYSTMVTIVKFFYTGKLEVKGAQFNDIYRTVKLMNILILTKLLEAHARKPIAMAKKEPSRPIVFKQAVEIGRPLQKIPGQQTVQGSSIKLASPTTVASKTISRPLPPGVKTKTVLARVQPQTIRVGGQVLQGKLSTPKKLPIWKERKYAPTTNSDPLMLEKWPPRDEPPRPTRFEWPDPSESDDDPYVTPASHALMDRQKAAASVRKVEDIFDAVKTQSHGVKRSLGTFNTSSKVETSQTEHSPTDESPASKVAKVDVPSSSESINVSLNSTELSTDDSAMSDVNLTDETVEEVVSTSEGCYSQESLDSNVSETVTSVEETSLLNESSIAFTTTNDISTPSTSKTVQESSENGLTPTKRSAMKSSASTITSGGIHRIEKTVRFAPEVSEKENKNKSQQVQEIIAPVVISKHPEGVSASNHSKIISEVLKKYPDLVKENRNIKLKIVQKEADLPSSATAAIAAASKDSKSKVSYIVLKSTSSPDSAGTVVLKRPAVANKAFWDSDKTKKPPSGAENTTGPWLCTQCGAEEIPLEFETYYAYRRHLVDVHGERIDARICEYCGQKASKRNLLLYHLYTKHGVNPPKNCVFPHCDRCDYVALSESLLTKHKQGHDVNKEFACTICNASFKSNSALQGHMAANLHRNKDTKVYECPYCRKPFVRNINLKAHIRSLHKDVARLEEMEDPRLPPDETLSNRSVTVVHQGMKKRQFPSILGAARLQSAVIPENTEEVHHSMDGLVRSLVTADGQTIEILQGIDPNTLSVPVLVPSAEGTTLSLETQHGHVGTEFISGVNSDGTPAVFIMDSSQNAVEVDVSGVGVGMTADGSMIFEGGDPTAGASDQFIVQDMQGNQFRKITGIDETGKQVIFFQLQDENGQVTMAPAILDDSVARYEDAQGDGAAHFDFESAQATFSVQNDHMYLDPQKCSVFVSSGGVTLPVTVSSDAVGGQATQVLLSNLGASVPAGHVIEFHTAGEHSLTTHDPSVVVTSESLMNQVQQGHVQLHAVGGAEQHHHLIQSQGPVDAMGQQLHIVLGQNQVGVVDETGKPPTPTSSSGEGDNQKIQVINQVIESMQHQVAEVISVQPASAPQVEQPLDSISVVATEQQEQQHEVVIEPEDEQIVTLRALQDENKHDQEDVDNAMVVHEPIELNEAQEGVPMVAGPEHTKTTVVLEPTPEVAIPPILEDEETGNGQVEFQECMQIVEEEPVSEQVELTEDCMEVDEQMDHQEAEQVEEIEVQESMLVEESVIDHQQAVQDEEVVEGVQIEEISDEASGTVSVSTVEDTIHEEPTQQVIIEEGDLQISENLSTEQEEVVGHSGTEILGNTSDSADTHELMVEDAVVDVI